MQLGEVFEQTTAHAPPPRRPSRWRFLLPVAAVGALAGSLVLHGPGVTRAEPHELLVITNPTGLDLLGADVRVAPGKGRVFFVPVLTQVHRLPRGPRSPDPVAFTAPTSDGVPVRYSRALVTYRLDPAGAEAVFRRLGADPEGWDAFVRAHLAQAWSAVVGQRPALGLDEPTALVPEVEPALRAALAGLFLVGELRPPLAAPVPEIEAELAVQRAAEGARAEAGRARVAARAAAEDAARQRADARAAALSAARGEADRAIEAARTQARARLAEAQDQADAHAAEAVARRDALRREAERLRLRAPREAAALAARVDAVAAHGPALLDHVIATEIMPQLEHLGRPAAAPATDAPEAP